jgi:hypothetical protein
VKLPAHRAGFAGHLPAIHQTAGEKATDATPPFGFAQGHESFDLAQDRELVERPVEWQMDVIRRRQESVCISGGYL